MRRSLILVVAVLAGCGSDDGTHGRDSIDASCPPAPLSINQPCGSPRVCTYPPVRDGGGPLTVLCGAPNTAATVNTISDCRYDADAGSFSTPAPCPAPGPLCTLSDWEHNHTFTCVFPEQQVLECMVGVTARYCGFAGSACQATAGAPCCFDQDGHACVNGRFQ